MPAFSPRCEIAVSQLPRWPIVSLIWSSAKAGMAALDGGDRLLEGRDQLARLCDRAEALRALRARQRGEVDVGLRDALADPAVLHRPRADAGDPFLVQFVIEERAIVGDHDEQRDAVMHR